MKILEAMLENENTEKEIEQWTENHRASAAINDAPIEEMENRFVTLKRERSLWCWARRKKNSEEIRRRKKNPRNTDGGEEEGREGERRKNIVY